MMEDVCKLVAVSYTEDAIGQRIPMETEREVFCNILSISRSEWFQAGQTGLKPELMITVFSGEYNEEQEVELRGVRYAVYRTFLRADDFVEIYLQRKAGVVRGDPQ